MYVPGDLGDNDCPLGYVSITNQSDCLTAVKYLSQEEIRLECDSNKDDCVCQMKNCWNSSVACDFGLNDTFGPESTLICKHDLGTFAPPGMRNTAVFKLREGSNFSERGSLNLRDRFFQNDWVTDPQNHRDPCTRICKKVRGSGT